MKRKKLRDRNRVADRLERDLLALLDTNCRFCRTFSPQKKFSNSVVRFRMRKNSNLSNFTLLARYAQMARLSVNTNPESSKHGTVCCGLILRNSGVICSPAIRLTVFKLTSTPAILAVSKTARHGALRDM